MKKYLLLILCAVVTTAMSAQPRQLREMISSADSLRMTGNYRGAMAIHRTLDSLVTCTGDVASRAMMLDSRSILYHHLGDYGAMMVDIAAQLALEKPDSLLYRDIMAYIVLFDFHAANMRYDLAMKYHAKARAITDRYRQMTDHSARKLAEMEFYLGEGRAQLLSFRDSAMEAVSVINDTRRFALREVDKNSLDAMTAKALGKMLPDSALAIYQRILDNGNLTFDNRASIMTQYIALLLDNGELVKARLKLVELNNFRQWNNITKSYYLLWSRLYEAEGKTDSALTYLHRAIAAGDSIERAYMREVAAISTDWFETEEARREADANRDESQRKTVWLTLLSIMLAGTTATVLTLRRRKRRGERKQAVTKQKLSESKSALSSVTMRAETLSRTHDELRAVIQSEIPDLDKLKNIRELLKTPTPTGEPRHLDLNNFDSATSDFITKLSIVHKNLTNAEKRMATMVWMNLSNKEIALSINRSPSTVKYTKYQLRKKLGCRPEESTEDYLRRLSAMDDDQIAAFEK